MRPVLAIAARDLGGLFRTATGWLVLAGFLLLAGALWLALVNAYVLRVEFATYDPYASSQPTLADDLLTPWFGNLTIVLLVVGPAVTMRSFADEVRHQTADLLATAPLHTWQIVAGKLLAGVGFVALAVASVLWMPLSLHLWATPDPGALTGGVLALLLLGTAVTAVGTLASSFTDSPPVALVLSFAACLALWVAGRVDPDPTSLAAHLSFSRHVELMIRGGLRASDVAYFLLLTTVCAVATTQRVAAWRWA